MILIQDRIVVASADLARLKQLLRDHYQAPAEQRGMQLLECRVSPPLKLKDGSNTLWLRWQVEDIGAWWAMRAQAATPDVTAFWAEVDSFCAFRERVYLNGEISLPEADAIEALQAGTRGYRETCQLALRDNISDADRKHLLAILAKAETLPGIEIASLGENIAPEYAAGHYTWDLLYPDEDTAVSARNSELWLKEIEPALDTFCKARHALALETISAGMRCKTLSGAIKRTAYFRLLPGVDTQTAHRFENDLLEMPAQIPEILNWRLSRALELPWNVSEQAAWTYVWEQEFQTLDDLLGPYMTNPHHWAHIDRWFDPESGAQAIDVNLSHAFSPLGKSLIAKERAPLANEA